MKETITGYVERRSDHRKAAPTVVKVFGASFVEEMVKVFRELNIEYRMLHVDVNLRQLPPPANILNRLPLNWTVSD
ncbi:hypothetical protein M569_13858 [Genlisea aurea]|uniref:Uncharacterized protein n=1 Tax=Genlisea aurea TaxID=192259 RepID=S8C2C9_9LAMI|nr:hypothetical protein M569_13858 [Genlisea aurea]